jgi:NADH:ubiquinone oxidoreductase subunit 4 (subunit M)
MVATETPDLRFGEQLVLWPLAVLMLAMGVSPNYWLRTIEMAPKPLEMAPKPLVLQQARSTELLGRPDVVPDLNAGEVQR